MSRLTLITLIICSVCILGGSFGYIAYAGSIDCQAHAELFAANDYGPEVLAETSYDPCNGDVYWRFIFDRTGWDRPEHECTIQYRITQGTLDLVWFSDAHSWRYDPNSTKNEQSGTVNYVEPCDKHIFQILRTSGEPGLFLNIEATADYRLGTPH